MAHAGTFGSVDGSERETEGAEEARPEPETGDAAAEEETGKLAVAIPRRPVGPGGSDNLLTAVARLR